MVLMVMVVTEMMVIRPVRQISNCLIRSSVQSLCRSSGSCKRTQTAKENYKTQEQNEKFDEETDAIKRSRTNSETEAYSGDCTGKFGRVSTSDVVRRKRESVNLNTDHLKLFHQKNAKEEEWKGVKKVSGTSGGRRGISLRIRWPRGAGKGRGGKTYLKK